MDLYQNVWASSLTWHYRCAEVKLHQPEPEQLVLPFNICVGAYTEENSFRFSFRNEYYWVIGGTEAEPIIWKQNL